MLDLESSLITGNHNMINSTNTVNIDGTTLKGIDLKKIFSGADNDKFGRWVARPLALLAAIAVGVSVFLASAFLVVVSLALLPVLAAALWAMRTHIEKDLEQSDTTIILHDDNDEADRQTSS